MRRHIRKLLKIRYGFVLVQSQAVPMEDVFASRDIYNFSTGGIAGIKNASRWCKLFTIKIDHNENDPTNYVRE